MGTCHYGRGDVIMGSRGVKGCRMLTVEYVICGYQVGNKGRKSSEQNLDFTLYTVSHSTVKKSHLRIDSNTNTKARILMQCKKSITLLLTPGRLDDVVSFCSLLLAISALSHHGQKRLSGLFIGQFMSNKRGDVLGVVQDRARGDDSA